MSPTGNRRRINRYHIAAAIVLAVVSGTVYTVVTPRRDARVQVTVLSLLVTRDLGRLPARGTSAGQFCGAIGSLAAPAHCWQFGGASPVADVGATGGWDVTGAGSLRTGIITGLPVESGGVADFTGEQAGGFDNVGYYSKSGISLGGETKFAITTLDRQTFPRDGSDYDWMWMVRSPTTSDFVHVYTQPAGALILAADGSVGATGNLSGGSTFANEWNCVTSFFDLTNANASKIWRNGALANTVDASAAGALTAASDYALYIGRIASYAGEYHSGLVARMRVDIGVTPTITDHQALCGTFAKPLVSSHAAYADTTWSRSGGAQCYRTGAASATCFPGGGMGYRWNGTAYRWATDADSVTQRLAYNTAINCTNYTCTGAATATAGQVAPDGSKTASLISVNAGVNQVEKAATGYTNDAPLFLRMWIKCSGALEFHIHHPDGESLGDWHFDCSVATAGWHEIYKGATVTGFHEAADWYANATGGAGIHFEGDGGAASAYVWAPSLSEVQGLVVVPAGSAAVTTGDAAWTITNAADEYWKAGDTVTADWSLLSGTCFVTGNPLRFTGAAGSECVGDFTSLEIKR